MPHVLGYFPFITVWVCLIVQYDNAVVDLKQITDRTIPDWVSAALVGTLIIFTSFAFVQAIFQALPPGTHCPECLVLLLYSRLLLCLAGFYWGEPTRLCCILSLCPLCIFLTQAPRSCTASCRSPRSSTWAGSFSATCYGRTSMPSSRSAAPRREPT